MKTPFQVTQKNGGVIFSIEQNGNFILRGKKIGNDREIAKIFLHTGNVIEKSFNHIQESLVKLSDMIN